MVVLPGVSKVDDTLILVLGETCFGIVALRADEVVLQDIVFEVLVSVNVVIVTVVVMVLLLEVLLDVIV